MQSELAIHSIPTSWSNKLPLRGLLCVGLAVVAILGSAGLGSAGQVQPPAQAPGATGQPNFTVPCNLPQAQPGQPPPGVQPSGVAVPCPLLDIARYLPGGAQQDPDVAFLNTTIDQDFAMQQQRLAAAQDLAHQTQALGGAMIYDRHLSTNDNLACATCHAPYSGFKGGSSLFNATNSAQPGSVPITNSNATLAQGPNWRISPRVPQTYGYAPHSPVLSYNATQHDFYGGNFWDFRATGVRLQNPAAEQAQGPPGNPLEPGDLIEPAVAVYLLSQQSYAVQGFQTVWGDDLTAIQWPSNIAQLAATPGPAPADNPYPVALSPLDRYLVTMIYDHMAQSMAAYESGPDVSPFNSKFDSALANPTQNVLNDQELRGWALFRGKAKCNTCHLDGTANQSSAIGPPQATSLAPLFSDFTSSNLGVPQNYALPYLYESHPDQYGYVANPQGQNYIDLGVGNFLRGNAGVPVPNATWMGRRHFLRESSR